MTQDEQSAGTQSYRDPVRAVLQSEQRLLRMMAAGSSLNEVLSALVRVFEETSDEVLGSILLVEPGGRTFRLAAAPSLPAGYNALFQGLAIAEGMGSCGTAMHRGEMVIVSDIESDPLWANYRELALRHNLRACWSVPIKLRSRVVGSFAMYYREVRLPDEQDLHVFAAAARVAAAAIERERSKSAPLGEHGEAPLKPRILVVDDEAEFRELIGAFLVGRGYQVILASGALEAMEIFHSRSEAIDFVLTDVRMPKMNGPELTKSLMALKPDVKFLFMSGDTGDLLPESCSSIIHKPFDLLELDRRIREGMG